MEDKYNLKRFVSAQEYDYSMALGEIRGGRKRSHWIWYIFPQLKELGRSSTAKYYGLSGADEARQDLAHPLLGARLREITGALLALESSDPRAVMGEVDAMKLRSCMTLFMVASEGEKLFSDVIDRFYGGAADPYTLQIILEGK